jgi:hypothetical protein
MPLPNASVDCIAVCGTVALRDGPHASKKSAGDNLFLSDGIKSIPKAEIVYAIGYLRENGDSRDRRMQPTSCPRRSYLLRASWAIAFPKVANVFLKNSDHNRKLLRSIIAQIFDAKVPNMPLKATIQDYHVRLVLNSSAHLDSRRVAKKSSRLRQIIAVY